MTTNIAVPPKCDATVTRSMMWTLPLPLTSHGVDRGVYPADLWRRVPQEDSAIFAAACECVTARGKRNEHDGKRVPLERGDLPT